MTFQTTAAFDRDFTKLPSHHQRLFRSALHDHFLPAVDEGAFTGSSPWPRRLRIHQLHGTHIYSMTWSFSSPDGRATFHLDTADSGIPVLVWRRIGTHRIYNQP